MKGFRLIDNYLWFNSMPLISILVPIYNVENFLEKCLESIRLQSFEDFEVICINDGSTDNSLLIINDFVLKDCRFKLINKSNTGYGDSMNIGLRHCQGKYIGIVESDDFIEKNMFERLYSVAENHALDIVRCNYYRFSKQGKLPEDLHYIRQNKILNPKDAPEFFYQPPSIWASLYRKDFLNKNQINFLETPGASYQDISFAFKVYALCDRLMFINEPLLNYRIDNINSSVNSKNKINCVCIEYREVLRFIKSYPDIYDRLKFHIPLLRYNCYKWNYGRIAPKYKLSFLKEWKKDIVNDFEENRICRKYISPTKLRNMLIIRYLPLLYRWIKRS